MRLIKLGSFDFHLISYISMSLARQCKSLKMVGIVHMYRKSTRCYSWTMYEIVFSCVSLALCLPIDDPSISSTTKWLGIAKASPRILFYNFTSRLTVENDAVEAERPKHVIVWKHQIPESGRQMLMVGFFFIFCLKRIHYVFRWSDQKITLPTCF